MARVSFVLVAAIAAMLVVSTFAQSPAPSPSLQAPRKISPAPAVTATTPATALTPSTDATSPSSISDSPADAPSPAQNGAVSASFTVVGSMAVVVLASVFVM
ncbi:classical arabinogalactan protein 1-like [Cannabis sativa]|uniref:classical arabinogalactan protein 1-like n=1 Tax=Cannabis sativa TaxID=3483 RepID=UPI0029C9C843|nr:classical arabinogalactan protein 1-like [Cannabis sativa]